MTPLSPLQPTGESRATWQTLLPVIAILAAAAAIVISLADGDESDEGVAGDVPQRVVVDAEKGGFAAEAVYDKAAPGVVTIRSSFAPSDEPSLFGDEGGGAGQGSGFVVSDEGEIATNAHVVTDAEGAGTSGKLRKAREVYVEFPDRNQVPAEIVGFDPFADVALLKVDPEGLELVPLELGSSGDMHVGDPVAAIGSPFGREQSLSTGIVSATDRSIESLTQFQIDNAIQTDASINPGNSGGPLLDAEGRVIGINQQINTASGGNQGVGFAVPVDLVKRSLDQLRENGEVSYAFLGVETQALYPQLADRLDIDADAGAMIGTVVDGSPADEAGLRGGDDQIRFQGQEITVGGDVIVSVDGEDLEGESDLPELIEQHAPGDTVTLEVLRDGSTKEIEVDLGERPATPEGG